MGNRNKKLVETTTTLYELNKINMAQIEPVDEEWLRNKCLEVADEIDKHIPFSKYWTLMCREKYDFTIFNLSYNLKLSNLAEGLFDCLYNRGDVIDFTAQEDGSYEIWIRDTITKENFAYYLFDYSNGVVEV